MENFSLKNLVDAYNEMCARVSGKVYSEELCDDVCGYCFTDEYFDVNYKDFDFTIECDGDNGCCHVLDYNIVCYDADGQFVCNVDLDELNNCIENGANFVVFCTDDIDGSFPNDKTKFTRSFEGIEFHLYCINEDRKEDELNNDNIRIIRLSDFKEISFNQFRGLEIEIDNIKKKIFS